MSEISSGLVAVAWQVINGWSSCDLHRTLKSATEDRDMLQKRADLAGNLMAYRVEPLVRLSDADAIISDLQTLVIAENQRKQQLEAEVMWLKAAQPNIVLIADKDAVISQQSKRIEELTDGLEESDAIRDRCAHLLAETAVALKGPEKALHRHGWQDLPEVAAKQSTALKLAREALMHDGYPCGNGCKCRACEALAAIDALGEVK